MILTVTLAKVWEIRAWEEVSDPPYYLYIYFYDHEKEVKSSAPGIPFPLGNRAIKESIYIDSRLPGQNVYSKVSV